MGKYAWFYEQLLLESEVLLCELDFKARIDRMCYPQGPVFMHGTGLSVSVHECGRYNITWKMRTLNETGVT